MRMRANTRMHTHTQGITWVQMRCDAHTHNYMRTLNSRGFFPFCLLDLPTGEPKAVWIIVSLIICLFFFGCASLGCLSFCEHSTAFFYRSFFFCRMHLHLRLHFLFFPRGRKKLGIPWSTYFFFFLGPSCCLRSREEQHYSSQVPFPFFLFIYYYCYLFWCSRTQRSL